MIATPYLSLFHSAQNELVHVYYTIHRVLATGFHSLSDLMHEQTGSLFGYSIENGCVPCRKTLGGGRYLKADVKGLSYTELYLMEQRIGCSRLSMTTDVARGGMILAYLTSLVSTFESVFSFDLREVFLAI